MSALRSRPAGRRSLRREPREPRPQPRTPKNPEPLGNLLRTLGRIVLWATVLLVFGRGLVAIFARTHHQAQPVAASQPTASFPDDEARAFAVQFARAYLTFDPQHPNYHTLSVKPYLASSLAAGVQLPGHGPSQTVTAAAVARTQTLGADRSLITVAVTVFNDTVTTRYLAVPVARDAHGGLDVYAYPSFAAPPPPGSSSSEQPTPLSDDPAGGAIEDLLNRFLPTYLAGGQTSQLSYYLAPGANVPALGIGYALRDITGFGEDGPATGPQRTVLVTLHAQDPGTRATYLLRYRIALLENGGRWLVSGIDGNPNQDRSP